MASLEDVKKLEDDLKDKRAELKELKELEEIKEIDEDDLTEKQKNRLEELEDSGDIEDRKKEITEKIEEIEEGKDAEYYQDVADNAHDEAIEVCGTVSDITEQDFKDKEKRKNELEAKKNKTEKEEEELTNLQTKTSNYEECKEKQEIADKKQKIATSEQDKEDRELDKENKELDNSDRFAEDNIWEGASDLEIGWSPFEPYKAYKYRVFFVPISLTNGSMEDIKKSKFNTAILLGANAVLGFNKIEGILNETPAYAYNEGGENAFGNTFPMHTGAGDVTLSHGATRMPTMSLIRNMVAGSKDSIYEFAQFHLIIFMYGKGLPQFWVLRNVWPTKIEIGGFSTDNASSGDVIIESLTVSVERAEVEAVAITNAFKKSF